MHAQELILRHIVELTNGLPFVLDPCSGSSLSQTYRVNCFVKVGPGTDIEAEFAAYQRLNDAVGEHATKMLPKIHNPQPFMGEDALLLIEPVHGVTLEMAILSLAQAPPAELSQIHGHVQAMISHTLEHLQRIRRGSMIVASGVLPDFVVELNAALQENLRRGGLNCPVPDLVTDHRLLVEGAVCASHRDLSVVNIIGDASGVKFIDPRGTTPNAKSGPPLASPALDLVSLAVSLERKELELKRLGYDLDLPGTAEISSELSDLEQAGHVTHEMRQLCEAVVRSVYVACRCEYCTAQSRAWLYDHMVQSTTAALAALGPS